MRTTTLITLLLVLSGTTPATANIFQSTLMEANQPTAEVSTDELRLILSTGSAVVWWARASPISRPTACR